MIDKDWLVVKEQDPIAGEIVRAGQTVVLTVQSLTEDEFRIQEFYKKYEGEPAADINVSLFEKEIGIISASGEIPLGRKNKGYEVCDGKIEVTTSALANGSMNIKVYLGFHGDIIYAFYPNVRMI